MLKKIFVLGTFFLLIFAVCIGCEDTPAPLVPLIEPEKIDVKFPDTLPDYTPEINVFPLMPDINGKVKFIDKNYNLIYIPEEAVWYCPCFSYETKNGEEISTLQAYCIGNKNNKYAVMNLSGEIITDFIYRVIPGEWGPTFLAYKGYLAVCEGVDKIYDEKNGYTRALIGVLDIRTGKEVVPLIYSTPGSIDIDMWLFDGYILASLETGENEYEKKLLDYSGNVIYDLGNEFEFGESERAVYRKNTDENLYYNCYENYIVMQQFRYPRNISVYDKNKKHIFSIENCKNYYVIDENVFIMDESEKNIYVINENKIINFKCDFDYAFPVKYENDTLILEIYSRDSENYGYTFSIDTDGNVLSKELIPKQEYIDYPNRGLILRYDTSPGTEKRYYLLDKNGNVIIPQGKYNSFNILDSFVVARTGEGWRGIWESQDIYDKNGNLLLADVYGYTVEIPGDGLIVYKSETVCGILSPDGSFKQINQ